MKKTVLVVVLTLVCCGFATNANAQIWDFIQKAAETTSRVIDATNDVTNYIDSRKPASSGPSYTKLGSVSAKHFSNGITSTIHVDIVRTSDGEDKVLKNNGSLYSIYENYSYDVYCNDPKSSNYYRYYFNAGNTYYFNW